MKLILNLAFSSILLLMVASSSQLDSLLLSKSLFSKTNVAKKYSLLEKQLEKTYFKFQKKYENKKRNLNLIVDTKPKAGEAVEILPSQGSDLGAALQTNNDFTIYESNSDEFGAIFGALDGRDGDLSDKQKSSLTEVGITREGEGSISSSGLGNEDKHNKSADNVLGGLIGDSDNVPNTLQGENFKTTAVSIHQTPEIHHILSNDNPNEILKSGNDKKSSSVTRFVATKSDSIVKDNLSQSLTTGDEESGLSSELDQDSNELSGKNRDDSKFAKSNDQGNQLIQSEDNPILDSHENESGFLDSNLANNPNTINPIDKNNQFINPNDSPNHEGHSVNLIRNPIDATHFVDKKDNPENISNDSDTKKWTSVENKSAMQQVTSNEQPNILSKGMVENVSQTRDPNKLSIIVGDNNIFGDNVQTKNEETSIFLENANKDENNINQENIGNQNESGIISVQTIRKDPNYAENKNNGFPENIEKAAKKDIIDFARNELSFILKDKTSQAVERKLVRIVKANNLGFKKPSVIDLTLRSDIPIRAKTSLFQTFDKLHPIKTNSELNSKITIDGDLPKTPDHKSQANYDLTLIQDGFIDPKLSFFGHYLY